VEILSSPDIVSVIRAKISDETKVSTIDDKLVLALPFRDAAGDPIEMILTREGHDFILDDLGHVAGLLFQLNQYGFGATGHEFVKNLCSAYDISIDYDRGILSKKVSEKDIPGFLDFIKVICSLQTSLPVIPLHKRERRTGRRLGTILGREVKQLKMSFPVQRQATVIGRNETWIVDYLYPVTIANQPRDVILVTADLQWGEPREKAAHIVTLAVDVLETRFRRDLRVVYDTGKNGNGAKKAASLIEDNQSRIGYKAFDFGDEEKRTELYSLLHRELSPLAIK
jgi:hypothetical protein